MYISRFPVAEPEILGEVTRYHEWWELLLLSVLFSERVERSFQSTLMCDLLLGIAVSVGFRFRLFVYHFSSSIFLFLFLIILIFSLFIPVWSLPPYMILSYTPKYNPLLHPIFPRSLHTFYFASLL